MDLKPSECDIKFLNEEEKMEKCCNIMFDFSKTATIANFRMIHLLRYNSSNIRSAAQLNNTHNKIPSSQLHGLRQYLKKFKFIYKKYYLVAYPNNLAQVANKTLNKLAIKSLFLLQGT